jgi:hypothetical protein
MVERYAEYVEYVEFDEPEDELYYFGHWVTIRVDIAEALNELRRSERHRLLRAIQPLDRRLTAATYPLSCPRKHSGGRLHWSQCRAGKRWRMGHPTAQVKPLDLAEPDQP